MTNHAFSPDAIVDRAVAALRATALNDRPPPALLARTAAAVGAAARAPRPRPAKWLRRPLAAIAAAAALATAVSVMIAVVSPVGSGGNSAFAAMLDKVREMKSVRYRLTFPGVEEAAGTEKPMFFLTTETNDGVRLEQGPMVNVFRRDACLMLDTTSKSATKFSNDEAKDRQRERPDLLGKFRQADGSWGEPIAGKQVGSVAARGYRVARKWIGENELPWVSMRVYVDPATDLPVRVEGEVRLSDDEKSERFAAVLSDFEWDIEVDPALLSLEPPAGYRQEKVDLKVSSAASPPEAIAAGLRFYADQLKGDLPSGIGGFEEPLVALSGALFDDAARKDLRSQGMGEIIKVVHQRVAPWVDLEEALWDLKNKNIEVHYLGKGLKAGNGSKIVVWWKAEKPGRAIAIYDDFSWKEIDEPTGSDTPGG